MTPRAVCLSLGAPTAGHHFPVLRPRRHSKPLIRTPSSGTFHSYRQLFDESSRGWQKKWPLGFLRRIRAWGRGASIDLVLKTAYPQASDTDETKSIAKYC